MRGGQVFMESLALHGVEAIFGNPGTTENPLLDRLIDYPDIRYFVALHEGVAVCAASFYAQATGKTAVANLHVAPGLGNGIGMMYGALKAQSPLIVTAGQQDTRMRLNEPLLSHDLVAMAAPVVKWSVEPRTADETRTDHAPGFQSGQRSTSWSGFCGATRRCHGTGNPDTGNAQRPHRRAGGWRAIGS